MKSTRGALFGGGGVKQLPPPEGDSSLKLPLKNIGRFEPLSLHPGKKEHWWGKVFPEVVYVSANLSERWVDVCLQGIFLRVKKRLPHNIFCVAFVPNSSLGWKPI